MKTHLINGIYVFEFEYFNNIKEQYFLLSNGYILIYDSSIFYNDEKKTLLAPDNLSYKEYYNIIKSVYPKSFTVYNMLNTFI